MFIAKGNARHDDKTRLGTEATQQPDRTFHNFPDLKWSTDEIFSVQKPRLTDFEAQKL